MGTFSAVSTTGPTTFIALRFIGMTFSNREANISGNFSKESVSPVGAQSTMSTSYRFCSWMSRMRRSENNSSSPGNTSSSSASSPPSAREVSSCLM